MLLVMLITSGLPGASSGIDMKIMNVLFYI